MKDLENKWLMERVDLEVVSDCIKPHTSKLIFFSYINRC